MSYPNFTFQVKKSLLQSQLPCTINHVGLVPRYGRCDGQRQRYSDRQQGFCAYEGKCQRRSTASQRTCKPASLLWVIIGIQFLLCSASSCQDSVCFFASTTKAAGFTATHVKAGHASQKTSRVHCSSRRQSSNLQRRS